jgi:hypothetical protein
MPKSKEERYWEWYERVERTLEEKGYSPYRVKTLEEFEKLLSENFKRVRRGRIYDLTPKQLMTLDDYWLRKWEELTPQGVTPRLIRYRWGTAIRFAIRGVRGWFGWQRIKQMFGL